MNVLYCACFIVISYLVGARAAEILQLKVGCLRPLTASDAGELTGTVITGAIYKREADYHGRRHQWIAPPPVLHAITVLEALSAPHRERSGRSELWLRAHGHRFGASEWRHSCAGALRVMDCVLPVSVHD